MGKDVFCVQCSVFRPKGKRRDREWPTPFFRALALALSLLLLLLTRREEFEVKQKARLSPEGRRQGMANSLLSLTRTFTRTIPTLTPTLRRGKRRFADKEITILIQDRFFFG